MADGNKTNSTALANMVADDTIDQLDGECQTWWRSVNTVPDDKITKSTARVKKVADDNKTNSMATVNTVEDDTKTDSTSSSIRLLMGTRTTSR